MAEEAGEWCVRVGGVQCEVWGAGCGDMIGGRRVRGTDRAPRGSRVNSHRKHVVGEVQPQQGRRWSLNGPKASNRDPQLMEVAV